jgi:hypothetical protein
MPLTRRRPMRKALTTGLTTSVLFDRDPVGERLIKSTRLGRLFYIKAISKTLNYLLENS